MRQAILLLPVELFALSGDPVSNHSLLILIAQLIDFLPKLSAVLVAHLPVSLKIAEIWGQQAGLPLANNLRPLSGLR